MQELRQAASLNKISEDDLAKELQNIESLICLAKLKYGIGPGLLE